MRFSGLTSVGVLIAITLVIACGGASNEVSPASQHSAAPSAGEGDGLFRSFMMGLSSHPAQTSEQAYRQAFEMAEQAGEVVLIQRTPPWREFVPGGSISPRTEQLTLLERELAEEHDLRLFLAVDPTLPGDRGQLANLPDALAGQGFANRDVRAAFVAYVKYLALNYKPAYMALGVEVDMIYRSHGDESFGNFLSLYFEAYDAVKSVSADTLVFPTFQYEDMLGLLHTGSTTLPSWTLVNRFEPKIDVLAVTSYPGLVFASVAEVPPDYYAALEGRIDRPIAFVSVGWHSDQPAAEEPAEPDQIIYLTRVLDAAQDMHAQLLIWYLGRDPEAMPQGFEPLSHMGLFDSEGNPKRAWRVWLAALSRPSALP